MQRFRETWYNAGLLNVAPLLHNAVKRWSWDSCSVGRRHACADAQASLPFANFICSRSLLYLFSTTDLDVFFDLEDVHVRLNFKAQGPDRQAL